METEVAVPVPRRSAFHDGLWWPDYENCVELSKYMLRRVTDVDVALKHVRTKCIAVQAGGFIGMWALRLSKFFERVYTFEPSPDHFACLQYNTAKSYPVRALPWVLAEKVGHVEFEVRSGGRSSTGGKWKLPSVSLDSLGLLRCDAMFLDIEGGELAALKGGKVTIQRFHPVIMLEAHPKDHAPVAEYLHELGYASIEHVHADRVYVWNN